MSNNAKNSVANAAAFLVTVMVLIAIGWVIVQGASAVGSWWQSITYISPEQHAKIDAAIKKDEEEWAKDPRNPKVVGQRCLDLGGVPDYSAWDGDVKACNKPGSDGKNVKIEVNQ